MAHLPGAFKANSVPIVRAVKEIRKPDHIPPPV
jgi:hypothetical protein